MQDQELNTVRFSLGLSLYLHWQKKDPEAKVSSKILGWQHPHFLLIQMPYYRGHPLNLKTGQECILRYLMDGNLYGFKTEVLKIQFDPAPLLFLKYPNKVENLQLRKEERIAVNIPVKIIYEQEGAKPVISEGIMRDISRSGCRISARGAYTPNFSIALGFHLPGVKPIEGLNGMIMNSRPTGAESLLGVKFEFQGQEEFTDIMNEFFDLAKKFRSISNP